jgi:hypothetical protein
LDSILRDHTEEAKEVVSVAMGKLKKRIKTAKEIEEGGDSSSEDEPLVVVDPVPEEKTKKSTTTSSKKHSKK